MTAYNIMKSNAISTHIP